MQFLTTLGRAPSFGAPGDDEFCPSSLDAVGGIDPFSHSSEYLGPTLRTKRTLKGCKVHILYRDSSYKGIGPKLLRVVWSVRFRRGHGDAVGRIEDRLRHGESRRARQCSTPTRDDKPSKSWFLNPKP